MARVASADSIFVSGPGHTGVEPALSNRFIFSVETSPVGPGPTDLDYTVSGFSPGMKQVDMATYMILNRAVQYPVARNNTNQPCQMTLSVFSSKPGGVNPKSYEFFQKWLSVVYDDATDQVGILYETPDATKPGNIGGTATLTVYGPDSDTAILKAKYTNIWPYSMGINTVNRDTDAILAFNLYFQITELDFEWGARS